MDYMMFRVMGPALLALALALAAGPVFISLLQKLHFGQVIRGEGPEWHKKKAGTPTMGGVIFLLAASAAALAFTGFADPTVWMGLLAFWGFGLIGFADDLIGVKKKRNLGFKAWQKLALQALIAAVLTVYLAQHTGTAIRVPFWDGEWELGIFYYPMAFIAILGLTNGTNLTDGLDGLLSSTAILYYAAFGLVLLSGLIPASDGVYALCAATVGALLGFLRYNTNPARVFMGDTGSLALGGLGAYVALSAKMPLWILIFGGIFLASSLSVMLQVGYFKLTHGKRIFKMAPLQHHFELCGLSETRIVALYTIVGAALAMIGLMAVR